MAVPTVKAGPGDRVDLRAPAGREHLEILDVRYQRVPVEPFTEPPGAESAGKRLAG
jgi:transcription elongation factor GreB